MGPSATEAGKRPESARNSLAIWWSNYDVERRERDNDPRDTAEQTTIEKRRSDKDVISLEIVVGSETASFGIGAGRRDRNGQNDSTGRDPFDSGIDFELKRRGDPPLTLPHPFVSTGDRRRREWGEGDWSGGL
ncbi:hypothetical protein GWG54_02435 [Natronococcus sp. JC468]|uniref:hypothetical protein n=1 Tax=Natronococcus sp. JC468 TaxID=1961921 RepID=UPI00143AEBB2|nr:hypothetical protein [Natronococcus sp. JC468]NKE34690.1 hypothetical protein [Natronococcus sp. JC468]